MRGAGLVLAAAAVAACLLPPPVLGQQQASPLAGQGEPTNATTDIYLSV